MTDDASWNKHSVVKGGGARAEGGSGAGGVFQQNTAQEGRQNNHCANPNVSSVTASDGGRQGSGCVNKDASRNGHSVVKGGGAHAEGGSSTSGVVQQNTAQEGRQNNNCANPNRSDVTASDGGRQGSGCVNKDASRTRHSVVKGSGVRAEGGSSTGGVVQQNTAQEGRQNNHCANPNVSSVIAIDGGRQGSGCVNKDASRTRHSVVKGGGARAEGGFSTSSGFQQNTAQEGRQNNNCANPDGPSVIAIDGGRQGSGCVNKDASRNRHSVVKGGGARAEGGSSTSSVAQQNTAQEGRQNNNCANPNFSPVGASGGGRQESGCVNKDASRTRHSVVKGGGARAEGGSSTSSGFQQNTAQEGRQNNNCANPNRSAVGASGGGRQESGCVNKDASRTKHSLVKGGEAHAEGGSSTGGSVFQQNTAQEGR
ncbi:hypothetical protein [Streptomyces aurantiogriseus]|uniref:hypothetical protein n=1 Tax=Streptomyces aurantiogriseus TaxID=66870 RepID=UPI001674FAD0|nr:hypothetical protein [Streptomyces aurantiogriseus]